MDGHIGMGDGRYWDKMEFELHEASCLLEVVIIKERWVTVAMRVLQ
jgi:hypothetical protein